MNDFVYASDADNLVAASSDAADTENVSSASEDGEVTVVLLHDGVDTAVVKQVDTQIVYRIPKTQPVSMKPFAVPQSLLKNREAESLLPLIARAAVPVKDAEEYLYRQGITETSTPEEVTVALLLRRFVVLA